ncbi:MAG: glycosyltransferase, partial [Gammaproteobacteria bacterium]|nr:glycosyltransferase [Gammaproteobacteria bacterium]
NFLKQKFNRRSLDKKTINKTELQKEFSLPVDASIPMIGMISRLVEQKGLDIILQSLSDLLTMPLQIVILGTGETDYEIQLSEWAQIYPDRLKVIIGYNEALAHQIEASSDMYLMPSTFEPCGLNQLYSLRYGTLPIVTNVGGLADTVYDANDENIRSKVANGFVLSKQTSASLIQTVQRAIALYQKPESWRQLQDNAMKGNFSWQASAKHYVSLYQQALKDL